MSAAKGDDAAVHFIRGGRFVCLATTDAKCRNYPNCECEGWTQELHGDVPAEGHGDVPQDECWITPWLGASDLAESYGPEALLLSDDQFPDGPVSASYDGDCVMWEYADDTKPRIPEEDES